MRLDDEVMRLRAENADWKSGLTAIIEREKIRHG